METKLVKIEELVRLPEVQIRTKINKVTVDNYVAQMNDGVKFDPIDVFPMYGVEGEEDRLIVGDGFHRIICYEERQIPKIEVYIHECDAGQGIAAAIEFSCERNGKHGLALSRADRRNAVIRILENPILKRKGDRPIAKMVGVSPGLVKDVRYELANVDDKTTVSEHKRSAPKKKSQDVGGGDFDETEERIKTFKQWVDDGKIEWKDVVEAFESASHTPFLIPKTPHKVILVRGDKRVNTDVTKVSVAKKGGVQVLVIDVIETKRESAA